MSGIGFEGDFPGRVLVVMPTWLGDGVMATPTLRALRGLYPSARISVLGPRAFRPMFAGLPWVDRWIAARGRSVLAMARHLRRGRFDMAVLLPNSFRSALLVGLAGIPRRVGYARDGRGMLLSDALLPRRVGRRFVKVPTRAYYLGLAHYLGAREVDVSMELAVGAAEAEAGDRLLERAGYARDEARPLVVLNPGANYGDAKMWYPQRYAAVADELIRADGAVVALSGSPKERAILDEVHEAAGEALLDLPRLGLSLGSLKRIVQRAGLVITNDTGTRHVAAALGTPVVTVFGPTDPAWTEIGFARERIVRVEVPCGPCQLKRCPLDHRCMKLVEPGMVAAAGRELLSQAKVSA